MKTVDLQIRMAKKMAAGRGAMQITQTDLDVLVQSGAYAALCDAATKELQQRAPQSRGSMSDTPKHHDDVAAALIRVENILPKRRLKSE